MAKLTAANCPVLANAKKLYNEAIYKRCLAYANDPEGKGVYTVLRYLSSISTHDVTAESLAATVASLPERAREAAAQGKRLPVGATRA